MVIITIESTDHVVLIEGGPCRRWNISFINGEATHDSQLYSRLLMVEQGIDLTGDHLDLRPTPSPPPAIDFPDAMELGDNW